MNLQAKQAICQVSTIENLRDGSPLLAGLVIEGRPTAAAAYRITVKSGAVKPKPEMAANYQKCYWTPSTHGIPGERNQKSLTLLTVVYGLSETVIAWQSNRSHALMNS